MVQPRATTRLVVLLHLEVRLYERLPVLVVQDDRHVGRLLRRCPLDRLSQLLLGLQALSALANHSTVPVG